MLRQTAMQWPERKGRRPERDVPRSAFWHVARCTSPSPHAAIGGRSAIVMRHRTWLRCVRLPFGLRCSPATRAMPFSSAGLNAHRRVCRQRSHPELLTHWTGKKLRGVAAETVHACSSGLVLACLVLACLVPGGLLAGGLAPGGVVPGLVPPCPVDLTRSLRLGCWR